MPHPPATALQHLARDLHNFGLDSTLCDPDTDHPYLKAVLPLEHGLPVVEICLRFDQGYLWVTTMDLLHQVTPELIQALLLINDRTPLGKFYLETNADGGFNAEYAFEIEDAHLSRGILYGHLDHLIENLETHLGGLMESGLLTARHFSRKELVFR